MKEKPKVVYVAQASQKLAGNRRRRYTLEILLALMVVMTIGVLVFCVWAIKTADKIVIDDPATGEMLLAPVVDATESKEICDQLMTSATQTMFDRNPEGLDHANMVPILFEMSDACGLKFLNEFRKTQTEYATKKMRSKVEIFEISNQGHWGGDVQSVVKCQQIIWTGSNERPDEQEVKQMTITFKSHKNPHREHRKRYPLMVFEYNVRINEAPLAEK